MNRVLIEMKISTEKCSENEVHWNNGLQKALVKIYEIYLLYSLLLKSQVMQLFSKFHSLQIFLKKSDHSLNWLIL